MNIPLLRSFLLCLPLAACGGKTAHDTNRTIENPDYTQLSEQQLEPGSLRQASAVELEQLLKNGLRISLKNNQNVDTLVRESAINHFAAAVKTDINGHSITNVQVHGVDEADTVKYDGRYIYLATPAVYTETATASSIKIFATDSLAAKATEVSSIDLDATHWGDVSELYLVGDEQVSTGLVSVRHSLNYIALTDTEVDFASSDIWPNPIRQGIDIRLYDVRVPTSPSKAWSLSLDGNLIGSRKVGNTLYIVSSFVPHIDTLDYGLGTYTSNESNSAVRIRNEKLITDTRIEKLLPEYVINDGSPKPLVSSSGCLVPQHTDKNQGYLNIINITTIDLTAQKLLSSKCINTNVAGIYSSFDNLYLGGSGYSDWNDWKSFTVVHKFSLIESGVEYQASGSVEGVLGWNQPSYRMDEKDGYLRMVTTDYNNFIAPVHHLNVLHKVAGRSDLAVVAQLPNDTQPKPIGKPREDIYSVRFNGDKAYIVTFERTDPLYVLDLATATDPKIAGELEIPGFSTYLHPVGDHYLFSLGNETDSNGRQAGVKVSLFDIRDITKPALVSAQLLGSTSSWSNALYDYRAISFLQASDDQLRIAFPLSELFQVDLLSEGRGSLKLFEINGLTKDIASLDYAGEVSKNSVSDVYFWNGNERGILHNDVIFYVYGASVTAKPWRIIAP
ncbi:MAG: beta-propeller domain-containing protein [Pseudomonadota bacterium]